MGSGCPQSPAHPNGKEGFCLFVSHVAVEDSILQVPHHDMEVLGTSAPCCGKYCLGRACSGPANTVESLERASGKTHGSQPTGTNA